MSGKSKRIVVTMIISASRRTDIPAYYSEWFFNRLREGFCYSPNPMNPKILYKIFLTKEIVDAFVFWSKNPYPMLKKLHLLKDYPFYFQYTITSYGNDIEKNLPRKKYLVDTFITLSKLIGKTRTIWRYDPILINPKYTVEYHVKHFETLCRNLYRHTSKVIVSFLNIYRKNKQQCEKFFIAPVTQEQKKEVLCRLSEICANYGIRLEICANTLQSVQCPHPFYSARCIDLDLINSMTSKHLIVEKDPYQREGCSCVKSYDIGMYNSCYNGCIYCYAAFKPEKLEENKLKHNPAGPILLGEIPEDAQILERKICTQNNDQFFLL